MTNPNNYFLNLVINGREVDYETALRIYANPDNWEGLYDSNGKHWVWKGPVIVGWELAAQTISGIFKSESLRWIVYPVTTSKKYCRLDRQCCPGCVYIGNVRPYCRIYERDLVPGDKNDGNWNIIEQPEWCVKSE